MSAGLRIAVWYNLPSGGARRALYDQVRGLVARGHHVEAWRPPQGKKGGFADLGEIVEEHEVPLDVPGELDDGAGRGYLANLRAHMRFVEDRLSGMRSHSEACARSISAKGFDLLYAHNDVMFSAPAIGRAHLGVPKVLYLQEPQRRLYEALPRLPWIAPDEDGHTGVRLDKRLKRRYRDAHDHRMLRVQAREEGENARGFDRILVNSYFSRESVLRAYGDDADVRVCYLGVDLDRFANRHLPRERFVLGLGAFAPAKNAELAIRAIATIERDRPPLVWVANFTDEFYTPRMRTLADDLGVDLRIEVMIPDEALLDRLATAGALVYAPRLEPFGFAPLEANACGLGVAAVAEGGVRETILDGVNGFLSAPEPTALGRAVQAVMADPSMGARAESHVRVIWGLERSLDEVERNLFDALQQHPAPSERA